MLQDAGQGEELQAAGGSEAPQPSGRSTWSRFRWITARPHEFHVALSVIVVVAITLITLLPISWFGGRAPLMLLCFVIGAVGGVMSNFMRQYVAFRALPAASENDQTRRRSAVLVWVAPLVGATFAAFLYVVFAAGLIQGSVFPAFMIGEYDGLGEMMDNCLPKTDADAAKLLVWSFVAGWSERLVPRVVDGIEAHGRIKRDEKTASSSQA